MKLWFLQLSVHEWIETCFGRQYAEDKIERNHRFVEEALEQVQALGCTREECHQLVDYVYDRPAGEPAQEMGGVLLTLAALANANNLDMNTCVNNELSRVWQNIDKIRAKQAAKPKHSPLPGRVENA
jgi:hypothetical protein